MSILDTIIGAFQGASATADPSFTPPCSNCPGDCKIAPDACAVCAPYKTRLLDALYYVDHLEEFRDRYEVVGDSPTGGVKCPYCLGLSADAYVCEYCGSTLKEGTPKIRVASASQIPNPVIEAENIIFDRYESVVRAYAPDDSDDGLVEQLLQAILGSSDDGDGEEIGTRMTEAQIEAMADEYGVSVSRYLQGIDNGEYLTKSAWEASANARAAATAGARDGAAGLPDHDDPFAAILGGISGAAAMLFGGTTASSALGDDTRASGFPGAYADAPRPVRQPSSHQAQQARPQVTSKPVQHGQDPDPARSQRVPMPSRSQPAPAPARDQRASAPARNQQGSNHPAPMPTRDQPARNQQAPSRSHGQGGDVRHGGPGRMGGAGMSPRGGHGPR